MMKIYTCNIPFTSVYIFVTSFTCKIIPIQFCLSLHSLSPLGRTNPSFFAKYKYCNSMSFFWYMKSFIELFVIKLLMEKRCSHSHISSRKFEIFRQQAITFILVLQQSVKQGY